MKEFCVGELLRLLLKALVVDVAKGNDLPKLGRVVGIA